MFLLNVLPANSEVGAFIGAGAHLSRRINESASLITALHDARIRGRISEPDYQTWHNYYLAVQRGAMEARSVLLETQKGMLELAKQARVLITAGI